MKIILAAVGRAKPGELKSLYETYAKRTGQSGLFTLELKEVEAKGRLSGEPLKKKEAELLLGALPPSCPRIALDERGREMDSQAFAQQLGAWRDEGQRECAFIIGGADGLDPVLRKSCQISLCLGRLTWPHMMVRALLAEQLYRASAILSGHPYHRE